MSNPTRRNTGYMLRSQMNFCKFNVNQIIARLNPQFRCSFEPRMFTLMNRRLKVHIWPSKKLQDLYSLASFFNLVIGPWCFFTNLRSVSLINLRSLGRSLISALSSALSSKFSSHQPIYLSCMLISQDLAQMRSWFPLQPLTNWNALGDFP